MLRHKYAERRSHPNIGPPEDNECVQETTAGTGYNGGGERRETEWRAAPDYLLATKLLE